jgi:glycosyltransferase involved in cell wall biosynthesis
MMCSAVDSPRVSILLPARNAADTLASCLASIVRQTESAWECIIVDDGSTDGTKELAHEVSSQDPRFRLIATPQRGLISALNEGLRHCRAPFVARMDADDVMHRERLSAQLLALDADGSLAGVGSHVRLFPRRRMSARLGEYERWLNSLRTPTDVARDAYVECPVAHPSLMMRREVFDAGYMERGWPEDYDLVLRTLSRGGRIGVVPKRLLGWRDSPGRLSRTDQRYAIERFTACKAHFLINSFLVTAEYMLWGYGSTGRALHRALAARGKLASHIVEVHPGRLGNRIHGALVIPPHDVQRLRGRPLVVSVAREGPRTEIRAALTGMAFIEGEDYVCAA